MLDLLLQHLTTHVYSSYKQWMKLSKIQLMVIPPRQEQFKPLVPRPTVEKDLRIRIVEECKVDGLVSLLAYDGKCRRIYICESSFLDNTT